MVKNGVISAVVVLLAASYQAEAFQVSPGFGVSRNTGAATSSQARADAVKLYGTKKYMKSLGEKGGMPRPNEPSYAKTSYTANRGGAKVSPPAASKSSAPQEALSPYEEYMASRRDVSAPAAPTVSAPVTPRVSSPSVSAPRVSSPSAAGGKKSYAKVKWQK